MDGNGAQRYSIKTDIMSFVMNARAHLNVHISEDKRYLFQFGHRDGIDQYEIK